ncbi:MAG: hypothetical protein E7667_04865 [Ruminococcaceae bacterium]|nr:hypothetical protein [Oscillospiraceae bacterium]
MIYYILVLLSALCYAVQFAANKAYQSKKGSAVKTSLKFIAFKGTVAAVVFFFVAWIMYGRPLTLHPMSVILACIASLLGCACWILGFVIFKYGSMSIFSTFLMIGGMTVPFIYSAFRGESLGALKIIGIVLLVGSLVFPLAGGNRGEKKRMGERMIFIVLCALVFLCNGGMSVFSSIHSGTDFVWFTEGTVAKIIPDISMSRVEGVEFTVLVNVANAVFCSVALGIVSLVDARKKSANNAIMPQEKVIESPQSKRFCDGKTYLFALIVACALLDAVAFILMRVVDASGEIVSVKYPIQTAFTVVLSAVVGFVAFREKPSRLALTGLIITFASTFLFVF